jgi:glycolate oxidase
MSHAIVKDLRAEIGGENILSAPSELAVYDCDAYTLKRNPPEVVVFPQSTKQVASVVKICNRHGMAIVPRGAGTGLAGGCLSIGPSILVLLTRMNRVLEVNLRDRLAVVEAGVSNLQLTKALSGTGCFFAPDPTGQGASTIGGNVATNAGGPHSLKYGVTVNNVLGLETVLGDGSILQLGPLDDPAAFDLIGVLTGSEGTLGIVTKIWLRLTLNPQARRTTQATFDSVDDAVNTATQIIQSGIIPSAMEVLDQSLLDAIDQGFASDISSDSKTALAIEIDGLAATLERQQEQILSLCQNNNAKEIEQNSLDHQPRSSRKFGKSALGATGHLSPGYLIEDGIVPRTKLPPILGKIAEIGRKHQVRIITVAHAGDGSLDPIILFDHRDRATVARALAAGHELLDECIALGGSVTAAHGIGVEKLDFMSKQFQPADLQAFEHVRYSFDPFGLFNPGKLLPPNESFNADIDAGKT